MSTKTKNIAPKEFNHLKEEVVDLKLTMASLKDEFALFVAQSSMPQSQFKVSEANWPAEQDIPDKKNDSIKSFVEQFAKSFFTTHETIIETVFKSKSAPGDLYYFIILKKDNAANRSKIFSFLESYDALDFPSKPPVYFQFVPLNLKEYIHSKEQVFLTF